MKSRQAERDDHQLLAEWNRELQFDEGALPMELAQIVDRLKRWLGSEYEAMIFEIDSIPIGYALFRPTDPDREGAGGVYLRHFFIAPACRRVGNGSRAFGLFVREVLRGRRLLLEALETNPGGQAFWSAVGLRVYSHAFELRVATQAKPGRPASR